MADKNIKSQILTAQQMAAADAKTIAGGVSEIQLIRNAGKALAQEVIKLAKAKKIKNIVLLCGVGNNGADGLVATSNLAVAKYRVNIICPALRAKFTGERKILMQELEDQCGPGVFHYQPSVATMEKIFKNSDIIIDALLGTGLNRSPSTEVAQIIEAANRTSAHKIAVDIPSGLAADSGTPPSDVFFKADMTVSFFRPKLCHYLFPSAAYCGKLKIAQIGIKDEVLEDMKCKYFINEPSLWKKFFTDKSGQAHKIHKYKRGSAMIIAGKQLPGAAILAARGAAASGSGLISIHSPNNRLSLLKHLAKDLPNIIVRNNINKNPDILEDSVEDLVALHKVNAVLIGPGQGVSQTTAAQTLQLLNQPLRIVLDADVFSSFAENYSRELLAQACGDHTKEYGDWAIMTPHEGEFSRIFPAISPSLSNSADRSLPDSRKKGAKKETEMNIPANKIERALMAAREFQAIIILKGADTIIALPDGRAIMNSQALSRLAVGGSGDILAGLITGLLAQGMTPTDAACASVWIHSQTALAIKHNFIPQELAEKIPSIISKLSA